MNRLVFFILLLIGYSSCKSHYGVPDEYVVHKVYKSLKRALKNKSDVVVLDLSGKNMTSLPEFIGEFKSLKVLNLNDNKIASFPKSFWELQQLEVLMISRNGLDSLPKEIRCLKSLKSLNASRNRINFLPEELVELNYLQRLDMSFNNLKDTDADADFIRQALPKCFVLVDVVL